MHFTISVIGNITVEIEELGVHAGPITPQSSDLGARWECDPLLAFAMTNGKILPLGILLAMVKLYSTLHINSLRILEEKSQDTHFTDPPEL